MPSDAAQWYANNVALVALAVSIGAVVVASVAAWYTRAQAVEERRSRELMEETVKLQAQALESQAAEAQRSAEVAERSARAAEESAAAAKILSVAGQRAWVAVAELRIVERDIMTTLPIVIETEMHNRGNTPGLQVTSGQWYRVQPELPNPPEYSERERLNAGIILPGLAGRIPGSILLRADEAAAIQRGATKLFVYGIAQYTDVFSVQHETKWAFQYRPETQSFALYKFHNELT